MAIRLTDTDCVIYEIPKTGTTFVKKVLEACGIPFIHDEAPIVRCCPRHAPWWCYEPAAKKVCIVRHPVHWYESFYRYHKFGTNVGRYGIPLDKLVFEPTTWYPHRLFWHREGEFGMPFDVWIERVMLFYPAAYTRIVDAFVGPLGFDAMDEVMRTETLAEDLLSLLSRLGYDLSGFSVDDVGYANKSEGEVIWTVHHRDRILQLEQDVIRRFYG